METTANIWKKNRSSLCLINFLSRFHSLSSKHNSLLINSYVFPTPWIYSLQISELLPVNPTSVISGATLGKRRMFNTQRNRMANLVPLPLVARLSHLVGCIFFALCGILTDEESQILVLRKFISCHEEGSISRFKYLKECFLHLFITYIIQFLISVPNAKIQPNS